MTKKEKSIPAYERALEEARKNLPISMDRMTGEERVLFDSPETKHEIKEVKVTEKVTVIVPDWINEELISLGKNTINLSEMQDLWDALCCVTKKLNRLAVCVAFDADKNESDVMINHELVSELTDDKKSDVLTCIFGLVSTFFPDRFNAFTQKVSEKKQVKKDEKPVKTKKVVKKRAVTKKKK